MKDSERLKFFVDFVFERFHRRDMVPPDPLQCVYAYERLEDREVAALLAASLAVGRAQSIVDQVQGVLERLGNSPAFFLRNANAADLMAVCRGFRYRFFHEEDLRSFLKSLSHVLRTYGSLESAMASCLKRSRGDLVKGIDLFAGLMTRSGSAEPPARHRLVARPSCGSACKRWHLFLRWLVRCDAVDPGGWSCLHPRDLMVPVDTHMLAIAQTCGLTQRRHADMKTAMEITEAFRRLQPEDPVRYDFSLTRMAMRERELLEKWWELFQHSKGGTS
ncbi:TIGR02757 family protein [Desulfosoma caldarium]|uniref:TIGR02757 family protein n=1 Tax=Desulfosoma caldarium TaxID=610254 RepID=UPI0014745885|nr:TIGR02757 family protein [Desulfosoma caldarium]